VKMCTKSTANFVTQAQQAQVTQVVQNERPENLQRLKRSVVRDACTKHPDWDMGTCQTMDSREVMIGMTGEQVRLAWGKPKIVNTTFLTGRQHEQWVYGHDHIYLENGIVHSMQNSR